MRQEYTAVIKKDAGWWIGWIEEIPVLPLTRIRRNLNQEFDSIIPRVARRAGGGVFFGGQ